MCGLREKQSSFVTDTRTSHTTVTPVIATSKNNTTVAELVFSIFKPEVLHDKLSKLSPLCPIIPYTHAAWAELSCKKSRILFVVLGRFLFLRVRNKFLLISPQDVTKKM